jgi:hypothetical protein
MNFCDMLSQNYPGGIFNLPTVEEFEAELQAVADEIQVENDA